MRFGPLQTNFKHVAKATLRRKTQWNTKM